MKQKIVFAPYGATFRFPECKHRSSPSAKVTWKRLFLPLPVGRISMEGNYLSIKEVQYGDEDFYVCNARNIFGKLLSFCTSTMLYK